jgi:hypothetical protein
MVTEPVSMSLTAKREYLSNIHGRYQRAGREHKSKILDEFCAVCGYHRKFALRLLNRALKQKRRRPGPKLKYNPQKLLPVLKLVWLSAKQPCGKLLASALPQWVPAYEAYHRPLKAEVLVQLLVILNVGYQTSLFEYIGSAD